MIENKFVTYLFIISTICVFIIHFFFEDIFFGNYTSQFLFFLLPLIWPGIAHGSLDYEVGKKIGLINNKYQSLMFFIVYIILAILFAVFWLISPDTFMIIFLALSIFHFGSSDQILLLDTKFEFLEVLLRGSIPIVIPFFFFKEQVFEIFQFLSINNLFLEKLLFFLHYYNFLLIFLFITTVFLLVKNDKITTQKKLVFLVETIFLVFCFIYFEPLISFSLYFCFLHSVRHLMNEKKNLNFSYIKTIIKTLPLTFLTFLSLIFIYVFLESYEYKFLSILFISLASLTVPHMFIVFLSRKH